MAQIQFSLTKKIKIRHPKHLLTPHPLRPITSHICLTPTPTPPQNGRHMCITPYTISVYMMTSLHSCTLRDLFA